MLRRHKSLIGIGLIIVFALGGIAGPLVHRVDHSAEVDAAQQAAHDHEHHDDEESLFANTSSELPECELCEPILYDATPVIIAGKCSVLKEAKFLCPPVPDLGIDRSGLSARAPPVLA